jgi:hypothetical protein
MSEKWYNNDWFLCMIAAVAAAITIIGNYYYHGGHLVW